MVNPYSDFYIDHELRLRMLEKSSNTIISLMKWLLGTVIIGIALPVTLHSFGLI